MIEQNAHRVVSQLTKSEATIMANAINEVCHGPEAIPESEFGTRIGASRQQAEPLQEALGEAF